ncbi:hypothetical protein D9V29_03595 [Mycetocola manganoxydans]|uniref:YtxH domain-containing protein n=2 Tax=Mycetocola manganoxydans TaxID=699879 RepID=A0A3L6ZZE0_9MICO|nr:hypothetical protein D9V29_03595 [Mycetocola manganoxydans]
MGYASTETKEHKMGRFLFIAAMVSGAYALGARARDRRERYDEKKKRASEFWAGPQVRKVRRHFARQTRRSGRSFRRAHS